MKPKSDRRRHSDVSRAGGQRATDRVTPGSRLWLWIAVLWTIAAIAGAAYGAGWLQRRM